MKNAQNKPPFNVLNMELGSWLRWNPIPRISKVTRIGSRSRRVNWVKQFQGKRLSAVRVIGGARKNWDSNAVQLVNLRFEKKCFNLPQKLFLICMFNFFKDKILNGKMLSRARWNEPVMLPSHSLTWPVSCLQRNNRKKQNAGRHGHERVGGKSFFYFLDGLDCVTQSKFCKCVLLNKGDRFKVAPALFRE